jgi:hypothetical protein
MTAPASSRTRLDKLKKRQAQLKAQIQTLEAAEKARERKRETRRKILVGAFTLDQAREHGTVETLIQQLDHYLTREPDRALFELPSKQRSTLDKKQHRPPQHQGKQTHPAE